ncbi:MAG TPA: AraC family transcriptional regulator [Fontimonas sp.]
MQPSRNDVLEAVLGAHQLQVSIIDAPEYCGTWFEDEKATPEGSFHLIDSGACIVRCAMFDSPLRLATGDLVVFPRGAAHTLSNDPAQATPDGGFSTLICGVLEFPDAQRNPVLQALPEAFVIRAEAAGSAFRDLAKVLGFAARSGMPGQRVIMNKLADSLFVMAVCVYAAQEKNPAGLFAALSDMRLARVLAAIHGEPGKPWRIDSMAALAGMSRTAFADAFTGLLGIGPFQYLTEWRITEAQRLLRDRQISVASVAERLGYQSEAAFRRTYKRVTGVGPGQTRRRPS